MISLYALIALYILFYGTWIFYVAFMHFKIHKDYLKENVPIIYYGLLPFYVVALFMDILFNIVIGTLYYRELPKELLFTTRCARHLKGTGVQLMRATRVCMYLLNPFDKGHCA